MSQNWMRHFELQLSGENSAVSLSAFRVTFTIEWDPAHWPRVATVRLYNLAADTRSRVLGREFSQIKIVAGYDGLAAPVSAEQVGVARGVAAEQVGHSDGQNFGLIFSGEIRYTLSGRDTPTDTFVLIQAVDGHRAFDNATVNATLAAGYGVADLHAAAVQGFAAWGVARGETAAMPTMRFPRGRALFLPARSLMDAVAAQSGARWQIIDGLLQLTKEPGAEAQAIWLDSNSGLVGTPEATMNNGVNLRCLINPALRVNALVALDPGLVKRAELTGAQLESLSPGDDAHPVSATGVWRVESITCRGDTRGQEWYMALVCSAAT